jgi:hypothetical protein
MSFGYPFGLLLGTFGGLLDDFPTALKEITGGGILPVAAAGNFMTPANGNGSPAGMDEPISVVATGPFDGITPYSAGGIGSVDEDEDDVDRKPDVTAPGGDVDDYAVLFATAVADANLPADVGYPVPSYYELVRAALTADPAADYDAEDPPRDYTSKGGTSMASPFVCGVSGLVAQAMEEAAPDSIALPEPAATTFDDVMRFKQVILATASETAFTAAPYHLGKSPSHAPTYDHGGRDPYEGYGRVNPDAAVDAVSRNLLPAEALTSDHEQRPTRLAEPEATYETAAQESVGLNVPEHSRAVAGFVDVRGGSLDVSVDFTRYSGGNRRMTKDDPHLDLFVYDAENPADNGEPNVVASAQGREGSASVSVSVDRRATQVDDYNRRTFYVVAKLVNVPGAVNGFDIKAHFDLDVSYEAAEQAPMPSFSVSGTRTDDGHAFTAGQTNTIDVEVTNEDLTDHVSGDTTVEIIDRCPVEWEVLGYADGTREDPDSRVVVLDTVTASELDGASYRYLVEAPDQTGGYDFGPAAVRLPGDVGDVENSEAEFGSPDTNYVVGPDQNDPVGSSTENAGDTAGGETGSATDGVTDTVEDTL